MNDDRRVETFDVAIAGGGPTGLTLACELALAGVRAVLLERHAEQPPYCRGFTLNARSLELLDRRGLADRFLAEGYRVPIASFAGLEAPLNLATLDTDHPYTLGIPQTRTEQLLEAHAIELGVPVRRGHELIGAEQDDGGVSIEVRGPEGIYALRASYLAGCDGGRSTVRKGAGIGFPGTDATTTWLLGDVVVADPTSLTVGSHRTEHGSVVVIPRPGYVRVITAERTMPKHRDATVTLDEFREAVCQALGREVEFVEPRWLTRFGDAARQAERYVSSRIMLAGDAAHIHPPAGAQGLNIGLQDAFNLGWKLAANVQGKAPRELLESYHTERHAVGAKLLLNTRAQVALAEPQDRLDPLRALMSELAALAPVRRHLAEMVTGVGTRYDMGVPDADAHPMLGRLAPNVTLETAQGPRKLSSLLHPGRGVLLDLGGKPELCDIASNWSDRVAFVQAAPMEWRGIGSVLIRPDGHAAWIRSSNDGTAEGLPEALTRWFGPEMHPHRAQA
ncbi:FAD-dependent monooxygenase [Singulisphaera sp. PoT]|uniref:FAD-dependent monooxygenase n=1 Tax=Singulisphaera sp. PoT TaxID=3411797 RepID=UPI003BF5EC1C